MCSAEIGNQPSNLDLVLVQTPCHSTRGALKRRPVVPRVVIIVFHLSYRKLTAFLYILFIILVTLPASHAVTCAVAPYYPHRQNGLSTKRQALSPLPNHFVSAAS